MNRRKFLFYASACIFTPQLASAKKVEYEVNYSDAEWKKRLSALQFAILRHEGTERAFTSPLLKEHHKGVFACAGCGNQLFSSTTKYDSETGWPSFYQAINGALLTKNDWLIGDERTEYHCAKCGGHHGHIFNDGPRPTGLRYCSNGAVLKFIPL